MIFVGVSGSSRDPDPIGHQNIWILIWKCGIRRVGITHRWQPLFDADRQLTTSRSQGAQRNRRAIGYVNDGTSISNVRGARLVVIRIALAGQNAVCVIDTVDLLDRPKKRTELRDVAEFEVEAH